MAATRSLFCFCLAACGTVSPLELPPNTYSVGSIAELPPCDADSRGQLYYVESEDTVFACKRAGWAALDLRGPTGATGAPGEPGLPGVTGAQGLPGPTGATGPDSERVTLQLVSALLSKQDAVLDIYCYVDGQPVSRGTGTKTSLGTVVTARHVVDGCDSLAMYRGWTSVFGGSAHMQTFGELDVVELEQVTWINSGDDLPGFIPDAREAPQVGSRVIALHLPADIVFDVQVSIGRVVDNNIDENLQANWPELGAMWHGAFTTDYAAAGGSSGAPVFDDQGRWIGVHVGGYEGGLELNYVLPLPAL